MPGFLGGSSGGSSGAGGQISFPKEFVDPVTKLRVSQPENLIDTDFEYGLQPTKWETVELINNTPSFFSKSGDTTIPNIISVTTNAGTREITVTTGLEHGLAVGIPINVTGTKSITADGAYIINSIPTPTTFTYLCKDVQDDTLSIEDLYTSIITGEFFQGSQIRISDSEGIVTDAQSVSTLTVKTESVHGFGVNTPFYFLNLNSTISQEFESNNNAAKSFDASNSATAQTFDGSNTLSTFNIDWSNSATVGGVTSTISSVSTTNNTITVSHGTENFNGLKIGTALYYDVLTSTGYFADNPRGVVFLKTVNQLGTSQSTFQVSQVPDGNAISILASMSGTFQIANQARTFAGNNTDSSTEFTLEVSLGNAAVFDGANDLGSVSTVSLYSGTTIQMQNNAGSSVDVGLYPGAMVRYNTTGSAAAGLTNNTTYFVRSITQVGGLPGLVQVEIGALPDSTSSITVSGGTGTQTFRKIGISVDKDIWHVPSHTFTPGDMVKYNYPGGGAIARQDYTSDYMYVRRVYPDGFNLTMQSVKGITPTGLTADSPGVSAAQLKTDWGYETDGVYYISVAGVSTPVYCIMNSAVNGGGWMMALKATRGTTFNYDANFWTTANTLNTSATNRNDGDAKFSVFNDFEAKDVLAHWPDLPNTGGSITAVTGFQWFWLRNNFFNSGQRINLRSFFSTASNLLIADPNTIVEDDPFSAQAGYRFYGFNYTGNFNARVRWGLAWNNEGDQNSNDVSGGIGMAPNFSSFSAGDRPIAAQSRTGFNRSARVEIYVR